MIGSATFATLAAICTPSITFGSHDGVFASVVGGTAPARSWRQ
jgi:hypothetical protein